MREYNNDIYTSYKSINSRGNVVCEVLINTRTVERYLNKFFKIMFDEVDIYGILSKNDIENYKFPNQKFIINSLDDLLNKYSLMQKYHEEIYEMYYSGEYIFADDYAAICFIHQFVNNEGYNLIYNYLI